jgi:hypothetical protein
VVVSGSEYVRGHNEGVVYVFTEPSAGWSGTPKPVATLVDSAGRSVSGAAISGRTVVATADYGIDVFAEPAGGWSGVVHESARLTASDSSTSGGIASVSIDGPTIVAGGYGGTTGIPGEAYVFAEPPGGWSGNVHESAKLVASNGQGGDEFGSSVAISGDTIAVSARGVGTSPTTSGGGRVYVFTRRARGWSGTLRENATLSASNSGVYLAGAGQSRGSQGIAVSGNTVFAPASVPGAPGQGQAYVFSEPPAGWSGSVHEAAALNVPASPDTITASGGTLVVGAGNAYVFTEPAGGWSDAAQPATISSSTGATLVAISGNTLLTGNSAGGSSGLGVFVEPSGGWTSTATPAATMVLSGPGGQFFFASAAMSGGVGVAGAPFATVGSNQNQGDAYVFTEPGRGWSNQTESAKLVASDGQAGDQFGSSLATSGDTVVVSRQVSPGLSLYVFTEPSRGWSGTVHETARLTVTDPAAGDLQAIGISGGTIVIGTEGNCNCSPAAYVFTKPPGGWSGTVTESAKLTVPNAAYPCMSSLAIDGPTIAAVCSGYGYVFTQPASGWRGNLQPNAQLIAPTTTFVESVAALDSSIVLAGPSRQSGTTANPVVFTKPASGWSGTIQPAANLKIAPGFSDGFDERVVGSGAEVAALVTPQNDQSCGILPTCGGTLYAFSQPRGGWKGTIAGPSSGIDLTSGYPLAVDGRVIATGGDGAIDLFTPQPGQPWVGNASLAGVASGKPRLRLTFQAGQDAPPVRSFKLSLPGGLRFRPGPARGLKISAPRRAVTVRPQTIAVTLRRAVGTLSVTIGPAILGARGGLVTQLRRIRRYNRTHRRKRILTVPIGGVLTDAAGHGTAIALKITIR